MSELLGLDIMARCCHRGVVKVSITRLVEHVVKLEHKLNLTHSDQLAAQRLQQKLTGMDSEFKRYHLSIVDLLEKAEELENE